MTPPPDTQQTPEIEPSRPHRVRDRRLLPPGGLPRGLQTWLMVGIAGVMLLIILVTGRQAPVPRPLSADQRPPSSPSPDQIRSFQQQLADGAGRYRGEPPVVPGAMVPGFETPPPRAAAVDEAEQHLKASLFADNVAFSRRTGMPSSPGEQRTQNGGTSAAPQIPAQWDSLMMALAAGAPPHPAAAPTALPIATVAPTASPTAGSPSAEAPPTRAVPTPAAEPPRGERHRLLEGTLIDAVLLTRLDGTFSGPVSAMVTSPVYSQDREHVLIPAGARILGTAAAVQAWGDARLAVRFHRLIWPDGRTVSLDKFPGLSQVGETGLRDQVNRHYWQLFGASLAVGALAGLAPLHTRPGFDVPATDAGRQAAGASLGTSTARILDRYLNVLPTVTIREGYRLTVYLTSDLDLPAVSVRPGGAR